MAEIIMLFTMLLFVGFCTFILGLAIYEVYIRKNGEQHNSAAATQISSQDQNTRA